MTTTQLYCGVGKAYASRVRITALKDCVPVIDSQTGLPLSAVIDCVSGISTDVVRAAGTVVQPPRAAPGKRCWRIKGCDVEEAISFSTLNFGVWDLAAMAIMTGDSLLLNGTNTAIGFDRLNNKPCTQFALEIWAQVGAGDGVCQSTDSELWWYELYPNVQNARLSGQQRDENTANTMNLVGAESYANPKWGLGPYSMQPGDKPLSAQSIERMAFWVDANGAPLPLPTVTCVEAA